MKIINFIISLLSSLWLLGDGYFNISSARTDEEINEHYYMYQGRRWDQASVLYINPVKEGYINIIV